MKSKESKVTRGQALKAGTGAALTAFLFEALQSDAAASGTKPTKCCGPIDIIIANPVQKTSAGSEGSQNLKGIRITNKSPKQMSQEDLDSWQPMHVITTASVAGNDELGQGHGDSDSMDIHHGRKLGYDVWTYHLK